MTRIAFKGLPGSGYALTAQRWGGFAFLRWDEPGQALRVTATVPADHGIGGLELPRIGGIPDRSEIGGIPGLRVTAAGRMVPYVLRPRKPRLRLPASGRPRVMQNRSPRTLSRALPAWRRAAYPVGGAAAGFLLSFGVVLASFAGADAARTGLRDHVIERAALMRLAELERMGRYAALLPTPHPPLPRSLPVVEPAPPSRGDQHNRGFSTTGLVLPLRKPAPPPVFNPTPLQAVKAQIVRASVVTGVSLRYLMATAHVEASFDPTVRAKSQTGRGGSPSSAKGLYQWLADSWIDQAQRVGAGHGLGELVARLDAGDKQARRDLLRLRTDPYLAAVMAAEYASANRDMLRQALGRRITDLDVYMAHFLGPTGARVFLKTHASHPHWRASDLLPAAARSNPRLFYRNGRPLSVRAVHDLIAGKFAAADGLVAALRPVTVCRGVVHAVRGHPRTADREVQADEETRRCIIMTNANRERLDSKLDMLKTWRAGGETIQVALLPDAAS